jgi:hypothetical protein
LSPSGRSSGSSQFARCSRAAASTTGLLEQGLAVAMSDLDELVVEDDVVVGCFSSNLGLELLPASFSIYYLWLK